MIIYMFDIICVTNRLLCKRDFTEQIEAIARCTPARIILREKDLSKEEYKLLAGKVMEICDRYQVSCILHSFVDIARELNAGAIHVPIHILRDMQEADKKQFAVLGASCHSWEEAIEAERLGCSYIIAGHIFPTDCKKGLPPRGIPFLKEVCQAVKIPVYAIGGIDSSKVMELKQAGAKGVCVMSGLMKCENVEEYLYSFRSG